MLGMDLCSKRGVIYLTARNGETIGIETNCKTRSCVPCQSRLKAKITMLIEYGILTLSPSFFTTFTFKAGEGLQKDASYVRASWRKVLDFMRPRYPGLAFLYVIELTRQNQPHLHVVLHFGPTSSIRPACTTKAKYDRTWLSRRCNCIEHILSLAWWRITGDSYVVDSVQITSARKTASYLAKYFVKGIALRAALQKLGFVRSWAKSNTWPVEPLKLKYTDSHGWAKIEFHPGPPNEMMRFDLDHPPYMVGLLRERLKEHTGTDLAIALADRNQAEAAITAYEKALNRLGGPR